MEKTTTMNLRVNPVTKQEVEHVLSQLDVPMATAGDMFLKQIALTGGIPFPVSLPKISPQLNADRMSEEEFLSALEKGYQDKKDEKLQDAFVAFEAFNKNHL